MILPKERDPRLITIRRGGSLTDADHRLLALWAAACAEHVLPLFEGSSTLSAQRNDSSPTLESLTGSRTPARNDPRPREAIEMARTWVGGGVPMMEARAFAGHANAAARDLRGAARFAAYAAAQAVAVAHVAAHDLGAAAYAIRAVQASVRADEAERAGRVECEWQRAQLPREIRDLVLEDEAARNSICWGVFGDT